MPSSKTTKRPALTIDTTTPKTEPETPDTNVSDTKASQEHTHQACNSTTCPITQGHHHHQHDNPQHDHTDSESLKSKSTASFDSDLSTWAHLSVDGRTGDTLRTVCTHDNENGEPCQHVRHERKYPEFPRVDEPFEKITMEDVKAMEEEDKRAKKAGDGDAEGDSDEEWVVL
jgi:hypothetical protein